MRTLAAAFVLLATLAPAWADAAPMLRGDVVVDGDVIRLGDLFDGVGDKAEVAVAPAPRLGRRGVYDAAWLASVARAHDVAWKPKTRFDRVVVERASQRVGTTEIAAALRTALGEATAGDRAGSVQVELDNRGLELHLPPAARPELEVRDLWVDRQGGRFTARLMVADGGPAGEAKVSGRIYEVREIPVLRRPLASGEVVREADVAWIEVRADSINRNTVTEPDQILGLAPRRRTKAEAPLRRGDFAQPVVVEKGSLVTMVFETPAMRLTAQGRASEDGADGQVIKVMNTQSHTVVEGIVDGPSRVLIRAAAAARR